MSEREPITAELRELMGGVEPRVDEDGVVTAKYVTPEAWGEFVSRCDAIDAVHAQLERENAELRQRVAVLDKRDDSMHIGGSITDELRKYANRFKNSHDAWSGIGDDLTAIADRIDAEHERMLGDWDYWESTHIELPKDADGEYTNADDEMFWKEDGDSAGRVTAIGVGQRAGWVWTLLDGCNVSTGHEAFRLRHHHAPTVEDVLTKFGIDWEYEDNCEDRAALLKEYAKRLTLAGSAS